MIGWRFWALLGLMAAAVGGWWYVDHIRAENRRLAAKVTTLEATAIVTHKQQEASDRVQIELDDLREKSRARAAGLDRDLGQWLRNGAGCVPTPAGTPAGPAQGGAEQPAGAADPRPDQVAAACAAAAQESDDRADTIAAWQRWYDEIRRARGQ